MMEETTNPNPVVPEALDGAVQGESQATPAAAVTPMEAEPQPAQGAALECGDPTMDWDALMGGTGYDKQQRKEQTALYEKTLSTVVDNEVVTGKVVSIDKREVVVNVGYKSNGVISTNEFRYNPDLAVGDSVEVYVENQEDKHGQLVLSHKKARILKAWDRVNKASENDEIITGFIKCRTKGGMIVDVFGIEAFLPGSQIDVRPIRDYDIYVEKTMEFKVVKINQEYRNVVVSHRVLIEEELEAQRKEIMAKLEKGQVLEGTVKNITSYGVFVDLGGIDGLVHITDLAWRRIGHPSEVVQLDEKVKVVILDFDDEKKRISLGMKQLTPHPWDSVGDQLHVGDVVKVKVVMLADYGAFVEVFPGVEGLIHVSEMSWSSHLRSAQEFLKVGDEIEAKILSIDLEARKMSLGIKQLTADPWEGIELRYPVGSRHVAKVRAFTPYGIFVEPEPGIDGLVHISDLSWTKKIKHPSEFTKVGEMIEVVVLDVDKESHKLSLGHKQIEENPWDVFETLFTVGSVHEGVITERFDKGAVVVLPYGVEGFATPKNLVKQDGTSAQLDEKLPFKVVEFNKNSHRIIVSHTRTYDDKKHERPHSESGERRLSAEQTRNAVKLVQASQERTTLGDISELAQLREEMAQDAGKHAEESKPQGE